MTQANPEIDLYLNQGCMRCPLGGTTDCKVHNWSAELAELRRILLESGLTEEIKWKVPCYTFDGANVVIMSAFIDYCALSFFKGVLMKDPEGILGKPGPNTRSDRIIKFTDAASIRELEPVLKAYIQEAIGIEKAGLKYNYSGDEKPDIPAELQAKFDEDPYFQTAFEALTPGRQRGYLLHFSNAKQSQTRISRIEKNVEKILSGQGINDKYGKRPRK